MTVITDDEQAQCEREIALIRVTKACPYCDGPVDAVCIRTERGRHVNWVCNDCAKRWIAKVDELDGQVDYE